MKYQIFIRNWWIKNSSWPDGLEPGPGPKTNVKMVDTIEEARAFCEKYNETHEPGKYSRKAEFESV